MGNVFPLQWIAQLPEVLLPMNFPGYLALTMWVFAFKHEGMTWPSILCKSEMQGDVGPQVSWALALTIYILIISAWFSKFLHPRRFGKRSKKEEGWSVLAWSPSAPQWGCLLLSVAAHTHPEAEGSADPGWGPCPCPAGAALAEFHRCTEFSITATEAEGHPW